MKKKECEEMDRCTKRVIRKDLRQHKAERIRKVMAESKSTRRIKNELMDRKSGCWE